MVFLSGGRRETLGERPGSAEYETRNALRVNRDSLALTRPYSKEAFNIGVPLDSGGPCTLRSHLELVRVVTPLAIILFCNIIVECKHNVHALIISSTVIVLWNINVPSVSSFDLIELRASYTGTLV